MADNVQLPVVGTFTVATKDFGGVHYQRTLVNWNNSGTPTDVGPASPLPVTFTALPIGTNPIGSVNITDIVTLNTPTSLGKAWGSTNSTGATGVMALAKRNDASSALGTDGQNVPLQVGSSHGLKVEVVAGALAGPSVNDNTASNFTPGTTPVAPVGGYYNSTLRSLTSGRAGAVALTINGAQYVSHLTPLGDSMVDDTLDALKVTIAGGSIPGLADNAASNFTAGTTELLGAGFAFDDVSTNLVTEGRAAAARITGSRKLIVQMYESEANAWKYAAPAAGLVSTTEVTAKTAVASLFNYITGVQVTNSHATIGSEVQILDGTAGTVMHRGWASALGGYVAKFDPPLRGTVNTLVSIKEATATATTGILVNLQGYVGA